METFTDSEYARLMVKESAAFKRGVALAFLRKARSTARNPSALTKNSSAAEVAGGARDLVLGTFMKPKTRTGRVLKGAGIGLGLIGIGSAGVAATRAASRKTGHGHEPGRPIAPGY